MQDKLYRCRTYLGYSVTENGKVFSHRKRHGIEGKKHAGCRVEINYDYKRELKPSKSKRGYLFASVVDPVIKSKMRRVAIHKVVLDTFHGVPFQGAVCRHLDGNKLNNHYTNLKWGTMEENVMDRRLHGTYYQGHNHPNSKLNLEQAQYIKKSREKVRFLAEKFNVSTSVIESIRYGRAYKNVEVINN